MIETPLDGCRIVHIASGRAELESAVRALREAGVEPIVLDDPDPTLVRTSAWTVRYRVAVADEDVATARAALKAWDELTRARSVKAEGVFLKQVLVSVCISAGLAGIVWAVSTEWLMALPFMVFGPLLLLVAVSNISRIMTLRAQARAQETDDQAEEVDNPYRPC